MIDKSDKGKHDYLLTPCSFLNNYEKNIGDHAYEPKYFPK